MSTTCCPLVVALHGLFSRLQAGVRTISVLRTYAACHVYRGSPVRGVIDQSISSAEPSCATRDVLPCPCPTRDGTSAWSANDGTGYHVRHFRRSEERRVGQESR